MTEQTVTDKIVQAIRNSQSVVLISHISPDGDTCACGLALLHALGKLGKSVTLCCENIPSGNLQTMAGCNRYTDRVPQEKFDLAIAVDCGDLGRLGIFAETFERARVSINIDHHGTNTRFGTYYLVQTVSATCELIYGVIRALDAVQPCMNATIAQLLYTGMVTDTGGFGFSSVTPQTFRIAAELLEYGFAAHLVYQRFMHAIAPNAFALRNRVLNQAKFFENGQIAMVVMTQDDFDATHTTSENTEGIIHMLRDVDGVRVAVSIAQVKEMQYKVSFRTDDSVNAAEIALIFGGGGHKNAAGCRLSGYLEDVKEKLLKACKDCL